MFPNKDTLDAWMYQNASPAILTVLSELHRPEHSTSSTSEKLSERCVRIFVFVLMNRDDERGITPFLSSAIVF
jgi:hypothetical protein